MTAALLTLTVLAAALAAGLWWLCACPARLVAAGGVLLVTHPVPALAVGVLVTVGALALAAVLAYRVLREDGWYLVTIQRPAPAPAPVGGVAL